LQDVPEVIPLFVEKSEEGFDVVSSQRVAPERATGRLRSATRFLKPDDGEALGIRATAGSVDCLTDSRRVVEPRSAHAGASTPVPELLVCAVGVIPADRDSRVNAHIAHFRQSKYILIRQQN